MAKSSNKRNKAPLEPAIESVLTFDGQDDYIELPPASIPSGNAITCSFWAYGGDALPTANSVVCALDANGTRLLNIHLPWNNSVIYFDCGVNGGSFDRIEKQAQPNDYKGKWSHWAFTKDVTTGEMKIYLNGELWHSGTGKTFALPKTVNAQLCCSSGSHYYQGKLAQVQLWSRDRTQAEIQQDMHRRLVGDEPGLVSYWQLNEGSGSVAQDQTDNDNHGTIHGNPAWETSTLSLVDATLSESEDESAPSLPEAPTQQSPPTTTEIGTAGSAIAESASASPNIAPTPSTLPPEALAELSHPVPSEESGVGEAASAPPNIAPTPPPPSGESSPPIPTPMIAQPIPPVRLQGRQMVLVLDENHQGISAGGGALRPQGHFTIEAWVYPATDAGLQVIFADGETLFYLEGGELKFQTPLSSEAIASSGAGITSGSWYHVAVTRAGSRPGDTKLYINGVHNDNQKAISPVLLFGNTYLGGQPNVPDSRFQGKLLEVRVWRYARSLAEIEAKRLYPMTGRELGLVRYWSLNETVGSTLHDKTTNRAVGTLSSDAVWEEVEIPLKLNLDPQERLTQSTGLEDYGYWFKEMAKQQKTEADPPFRRGRIWA